jgi:putative Mn2+ efflux pump MntP
MTSLVQIFIIAVSLAMDALSVSIAGGIESKKAQVKDAIKVAAFFGLFQAGMPLIGWYIGEVLSTVVAATAHWIAFILLTVIGVKMIKESFNHDEHESKNILGTKTLIILSIATSIDALVVGITLGLFNIPLLLSITIIGIVTFIFCFFGYLFGNRLGKIFGKRIEIVGGITLIAIGFKILIENL